MSRQFIQWQDYRARQARLSAEVIHDLYKERAAPRSEERMIALVARQIEAAMDLARRTARAEARMPDE